MAKRRDSTWSKLASANGSRTHRLPPNSIPGGCERARLHDEAGKQGDKDFVHGSFLAGRLKRRQD